MTPKEIKPVGTHRIEIGRRQIVGKDGSSTPYHAFVLGCEKCYIEPDSDGVSVTIKCNATAEDNPNGHPAVVLGMDPVEDDA